MQCHAEPEDFTLGQGKYLVKVEISAQNAACSGTYLLINQGDLPGGFRLEQLD